MNSRKGNPEARSASVERASLRSPRVGPWESFPGAPAGRVASQPLLEVGRGVGPLGPPVRCNDPTLVRRGPGQAGEPMQRQARGPMQGQFRGSIWVLDKAVLSPPFTPPRHAGREYGFTGLSTALNYLFSRSRCHHFLGYAIKSDINDAKTAVIDAVFQYQKCYQTHFSPHFGGAT